MLNSISSFFIKAMSQENLKQCFQLPEEVLEGFFYFNKNVVVYFQSYYILSNCFMYFFSFLMVGNVVLKISSVLWCQVLVFWTSIVLFYTNTSDNLILYMEIKVTFLVLNVSSYKILFYRS